MQNITFLLSLVPKHFQSKHQIRTHTSTCFESCRTSTTTSTTTVYEFYIVETYVCQSFQTLYEASPIINVTHRSFAVFHPIMHVTHQSFAAPAPAIRDFFWLYHTCSLLRGGFYNASCGAIISSKYFPVSDWLKPYP